MPKKNKFVIVPDSFKGTLDSTEICSIIAGEISLAYPDATVARVPVADGGEGSVDCFLSTKGGEKVFVPAHGPYGEPITSFFGLIDDGKTAVIEMSAAAGLPMVEGKKNPLLTSTYGVGELLLSAIERGVTKVIVGLGGSCTNDYGCGMACACGIRFLDAEGKPFVPTGETLSKIEKIDFSGKHGALNDVQIITMCDIDNPPYGPNGASYVFAPQKGATLEQVKLLDEGVKHLTDIIRKATGNDYSTLAGGGAAGAMGAGMVAFFGSTLQMGINAVLDTVGFDELISDADLIFTGEGKIDTQSLRGKVVIGVARACKRQDKPVIAIVGGADGDMTEAYENGVTAIFTINKLPQDLSVSAKFSKDNLAFTVKNVLRLLKA
ncbi:MAG: glycerate kinase [Clostridia bacterium]|nr:glycerate kinase [Clostridia bacterium]